MTEETKIEKKEEKKESARGSRGELGVATAGLAIRNLWHSEHFSRVDANDKGNFRKRHFVRNHGAPSLKKFARELAKSGNQVAKDWFANKGGAQNAKRNDKNQGRINLEKQASKAARRKKSQGKQAKPTTDAATAAVKGK
jgi:hypothetical protein